MDILGNIPGAVVAIDSSPGVPASIYMEGWGGYNKFKSIITGFRLQSQGNIQIMHTLRDFVYLYSFGERIGNIVINGFAFTGQCRSLNNVLSGFEYAHGYYLLNRASSRPTPVAIVLGAMTAFYGFLTEFSAEMSDAERMVSTYSFIFKTIPQPSFLDLFFEQGLPDADGDADGDDDGDAGGGNGGGNGGE